MESTTAPAFAVQRAADRAFFDFGWLQTHHSFSFADYYDPNNLNWGALRVFNDDTVQPGKGFGTHPHRDMEIVTYVLRGELEHKDSMGHHGVVPPGGVQYMSAGTGVRHSEFNGSADQRCHLLQIWIMPNKSSVTPGYGQSDFSAAIEKQDLVLAASGNPDDGVIAIHQDAKLYAARVRRKHEFTLPLTSARSGWIQMISGAATMNGAKIESGDGVAISREEAPLLCIEKEAHFLLFDLP